MVKVVLGFNKFVKKLKAMETEVIQYQTRQRPGVEQIIDLYASSGLTRPIGDSLRIQKMYENSDVIVTAWDGPLLVGVSRAITDYVYCCYLSDLAVRKEYQHMGIGKKL